MGRQGGRTALPGVHPASDPHVRAVATAFDGMAGRVEEDKPRMMRRPAWGRSARRIVISEGQPDGVVPYVFRPSGDEIPEAAAVVGKERARRLFKSRQI